MAGEVEAESDLRLLSIRLASDLVILVEDIVEVEPEAEPEAEEEEPPPPPEEETPASSVSPLKMLTLNLLGGVKQ